MTRIIAGSARGRPLKTPSGVATRPTADRVREALFSALESELGSLAGLRFLDLFAGSGAVGLEARSRGAGSVTLVERDRPTATLIRSNANDLGLAPVFVCAAKAEHVIGEGKDLPGGPFDVVYVDPPYSVRSEAVATVVADLLAAGHLVDEALVVVERSRRDAGWTWPTGLREIREKKYGDTMLYYGRAITSSKD